MNGSACLSQGCRQVRVPSESRTKTGLDNPATRSQLTVSIKSWAQALANLPSRARWFPKGDAARSATKRVARVSSPPRSCEGGLFCLESNPLKSPPVSTPVMSSVYGKVILSCGSGRSLRSCRRLMQGPARADAHENRILSSLGCPAHSP